MLETGRNCLALSPCRRPYLDPSHHSSPENDQIQAKIEPPPLPSLGSGYGTTRSALRAGGQELAARKARDRAWGNLERERGWQWRWGRSRVGSVGAGVRVRAGLGRLEKRKGKKEKFHESHVKMIFYSLVYGYCYFTSRAEL
jgi:hypothetical protein